MTSIWVNILVGTQFSDEEFFTESQLAEVFRDEAGNVTGGIAPSGHEVDGYLKNHISFALANTKIVWSNFSSPILNLSLQMVV